MIVAATFCPHPPLLVPGLAAGATGELDALRDCCAVAVSQLVATAPEVVCVLGEGRAQWYSARTSGTFRHYGVDLDVSLGAGARTACAPPTLPLSLTVGAWLLAQAGWSGRTCALAVPGDTPDDSLAPLAARLTQLSARVGLLVMGDGSARRSDKAPGYIDDRAAAFDAVVVAALAHGNASALAELDSTLGVELMAAGTAPWRLLGRAGAGGDWDGRVLADEVPYGVGYFVASWALR